MRSIPRTTATSIRSISSRRPGHRASPREKYLRLAKLEYERTYQANYLRKARERASEYEERLAEIDREQAYLLTSTMAALNGEPGPSEVPRPAHPAAPGRTPCTLKY